MRRGSRRLADRGDGQRRQADYGTTYPRIRGIGDIRHEARLPGLTPVTE
jgi:hypothetical protein